MEDSVKPQHMPIGERNVLRSNDSSSLWNCTLSPGWNQKEVAILRLALMKFGVGNWSKIIESECLKGKTVAQLNLQTQKLLGQQSTAEFANLHVDPLEIGKRNAKKFGPEIKRKNGFIVNTGAKLTKEEKLRRLAENKKNYGLSQKEINEIELPTPKPESNDTLDDLKQELFYLKEELLVVQEKIKKIKGNKKQKNIHKEDNEERQIPKIRLFLKPKENSPAPENEIDELNACSPSTVTSPKASEEKSSGTLKRKLVSNYELSDSSLTDFSSDDDSDFYPQIKFNQKTVKKDSKRAK